MKKVLVTLFSIVVLSASVFASGFQINEHHARVTGMGGAFVGLANNASAVYFNPAGITQLNGTRLSLGATYIAPSAKFTGPAPATTESKLKSQFFTPANFYFTQSLGSDLYVGFGFNNPYGLGTAWEDDWVGRYRTTETKIETYNFSPVIAYKVSDELSVSAGMTVSYANVLIARKLQLMAVVGGNVLKFPDANLALEGDATTFGYTAGVLYKPTQNIGLGVSFHSQLKYDFEGDATTTYAATTPAAIIAQLPKGSITAPLTAPMVLTVGGSYIASSSLLFVADFQYTGWSSYDKLSVKFNQYPTAAGSVSESVRDYQNSWIVRAGTEYQMNDAVALRGGIFYDKNPIKDEYLDPTLPDADRIGFNVGLGYNLTQNLAVDLSYMYLLFADRKIDNSKEFIPMIPAAQSMRLNGTYNSAAHLIGLNFSYNF